MRFTPQKIEELAEKEVFVFGSNLAGNHAGGAAKTALEKFGAIYGLGEGLADNSYAFPTLDEHYQKRSLSDLVCSKHKLYGCAEKNPEKTFLVTKLGLGIAGYSLEEMRSVFMSMKPFNIILPIEFS